jgi:CRISPR-associated protein Cas1
MTELIQNTLYITKPGLYLHKEKETLRVEEDHNTILTVPLHHLQSITFLTRGSISSYLLDKCLTAGISVTYLTERGRFLARLEGASSGNVTVRMEQFRKAQDVEERLKIAKWMVAGKVQNARLNLLRTARDKKEDETDGIQQIRSVTDKLGERLSSIASASTVDELRGYEGECAKNYFSVFDHCIVQQKDDFTFDRRSRRPPRSRLNALLSFAYSMITNDCVSACQAAGLDPYVGYLHDPRSGRPSLALDLVEEFRSFADRFVLTLINRQQIQKEDIEENTGGVYKMKDSARKRFIEAYQKRKQEEIQHPVFGHRCRIGELPIYQARLLARTIRGDIQEYPPYLWR